MLHFIAPSFAGVAPTLFEGTQRALGDLRHVRVHRSGSSFDFDTNGVLNASTLDNLRVFALGISLRDGI